MPLSFATSLSRLIRIGALLIGLASTFAVGQPDPTITTPPPAKKAKPYKIASSDKLRISIFQQENLSTIARVDASGAVNLDLVQQVHVAGLTVSEAEKAIETAYREGRYLRNPQVRINVEEYAPREVFINGDVKVPARYVMPIETAMTVIDLVQKAGGLLDTAQGTKVRVTRTGPDGKQQVFIVDVERILKAKTSSKIEDTSLELEPGDVVFVPQRFI
jgi:polysaccharide biosynthesis/export protein